MLYIRANRRFLTESVIPELFSRGLRIERIFFGLCLKLTEKIVAEKRFFAVVAKNEKLVFGSRRAYVKESALLLVFLDGIFVGAFGIKNYTFEKYPVAYVGEIYRTVFKSLCGMYRR